MTWHPLQPRVGFWMLRCCRQCPFVASRIYEAHTIADPISGEPMDRSPFLAAQIGLEIVEWQRVWVAVEFIEGSPEQQALLMNPPQSSRAPRNGRSPALRWAPMSKWQRERAQRITEAQYKAEVEWLEWAARHAPAHPEYTFRKPIDRKTMPAPRFA